MAAPLLKSMKDGTLKNHGFTFRIFNPSLQVDIPSKGGPWDKYEATLLVFDADNDLVCSVPMIAKFSGPWKRNSESFHQTYVTGSVWTVNPNNARGLGFKDGKLDPKFNLGDTPYVAEYVYSRQDGTPITYLKAETDDQSIPLRPVIQRQFTDLPQLTFDQRINLMGVVVKVDEAKEIEWNNSQGKQNGITCPMTLVDETGHIAVVDVWGMERVATAPQFLNEVVSIFNAQINRHVGGYQAKTTEQTQIMVEQTGAEDNCPRTNRLLEQKDRIMGTPLDFSKYVTSAPTGSNLAVNGPVRIVCLKPLIDSTKILEELEESAFEVRGVIGALDDSSQFEVAGGRLFARLKLQDISCTCTMGANETTLLKATRSENAADFREKKEQGTLKFYRMNIRVSRTVKEIDGRRMVNLVIQTAQPCGVTQCHPTLEDSSHFIENTGHFPALAHEARLQPNLGPGVKVRYEGEGDWRQTGGALILFEVQDHTMTTTTGNLLMANTEIQCLGDGTPPPNRKVHIILTGTSNQENDLVFRPGEIGLGLVSDVQDIKGKPLNLIVSDTWKVSEGSEDAALKFKNELELAKYQKSQGLKRKWEESDTQLLRRMCFTQTTESHYADRIGEQLIRGWPRR